MLTLRYNEPVFILMLRGRVGCLSFPPIMTGYVADLSWKSGARAIEKLDRLRSTLAVNVLRQLYGFSLIRNDAWSDEGLNRSQRLVTTVNDWWPCCMTVYLMNYSRTRKEALWHISRCYPSTFLSKVREYREMSLRIVQKPNTIFACHVLYQSIFHVT